MERRQFVSVLGGATAWLIGCGARPRPAAPSPPAEAGAMVFLEGEFAGWARVRGGTPVSSRGIADLVPGHPPPPPRSEDVFRPLVVEAGAGMQPRFYAFASSCLEGGARPLTRGAIVSVDSNRQAIARWEWQGWVEKLEFPALDREDCAPATMRVQIAETAAQAANPAASGARWPTRPEVPWHSCDFHLDIAGLGGACAQVSAVSAIVCQRTSRGTDGGITLSAPVFSPMIITVPSAAAPAFAAWAAAGGGRGAQLDYLTPGGQPLLSLSLTVEPAGAPAPAGQGKVSVRLRIDAGSVAAGEGEDRDLGGDAGGDGQGRGGGQRGR